MSQIIMALDQGTTSSRTILFDKNGKIVAIEESLSAKSQKEINAAGKLVTPPFIDAHFHMDATLMAH